MDNTHTYIKMRQTGEFIKILILRTIGNFLIFGSLFLIAKTFYQPAREEVRYFINQVFEKRYLVAGSVEESKRDMAVTGQNKGGLAKLLNIAPVEVLVPEDPEFSIVVPVIGANARIKKNVDPGNEEVYLRALQKGVAHAAGTAFPGEGGHIFLFAHSTDYVWNIGSYNAVFYLLYKIRNGDEVNVFYKGQRYVYTVFDKKIVDPSEVEYLTRKTDSESLTLQTCWPPGTALQRLLVFAKRVVE